MDGLVPVLVVVGLLLVAVAVWAFATYNGLTRLRVLVARAWRQIEVELGRRHDLVPSLADAVRGQAAHERAVFEEVARARAAAVEATTPVGRSRCENELTAALGRLFAVAEGYPQLRATGVLSELQRELTGIEDRIAAGRRFYNANVRQLNARVQAFPSSVVAALLGLQPAGYFDADDPEVRSAPLTGRAGRTDDVAGFRPPAGPGRAAKNDARG